MSAYDDAAKRIARGDPPPPGGEGLAGAQAGYDYLTSHFAPLRLASGKDMVHACVIPMTIMTARELAAANERWPAFLLHEGERGQMLMQAASIIATGVEVTVDTLPIGDDKQIGAILTAGAGRPFMAFSVPDGTVIDSRALANFIDGYFGPRHSPTTPNVAVIAIAGNNIKADPAIADRFKNVRFAPE